MQQEHLNIPPNAVVAVALSGGVDSLMAAWELLQAGHQVIGLHARFLAAELDSGCQERLDGLEKACAFLNIPLKIADLREAFEALVIRPFIDAYAAGLTPNPCALCNPRLKFGLLLEYALSLGADLLATGHYARKGLWRPGPEKNRQEEDHGESQGYVTIYPARDQSKDQGYFLGLVPSASLKRAIFPLADQSKQMLRQKAAALGLPLPVPKESQEICFVPADDYRAFLLGRKAALPGEGPVCLAGGREIARHKGLWQYTEGQRRGLGIAWSEPLYVLAKNQAQNSLLVGPACELKSDGCRADRLNLYIPYSLWPEQVLVRVRYRQKALPATVQIEGDTMHIRYNLPQVPAAKGQLAAVCHPEGFILGAGIIY